MEKVLNQLLETHQGLIRQGRILNSKICRSRTFVENHFKKLYEGEKVEIEVFRMEPPHCHVLYLADCHLEQKKIVGQIKSLELTGTYINFIRINFWEERNKKFIKNRIETNLSNLKSIKIVK